MASQVDGEGIRLDRPVDGPLDVLIGGHRVWSFTTARDGLRSGSGVFVAYAELNAAVVFSTPGPGTTV